ncbi:MAG: hypothetical protein JSR59_07490 [Proteobacteria bacterium]|nr:hypothetical protein [Pseudomonadota bacterium]
MDSINDGLASVLQTVGTPGDFFAAGHCALHVPLIEVDGVGPIALPLLPAQAAQLIAAAERAPYGRGGETLVDTAVRRTWQIGAGCRMVLVYNLRRLGKGRLPRPPSYEQELGMLRRLLRRWSEPSAQSNPDQPAKLVYPMEHAYTPAELSFAALKDADAAVAGVLAAAACDAAFELHVALLRIEESGAAEFSAQISSSKSMANDRTAPSLRSSQPSVRLTWRFPTRPTETGRTRRRRTTHRFSRRHPPSFP